MLKAKTTPVFWEALIIVFVIIGVMSASIIKFSAPPHIPILIIVILLIAYGLLKKVPFQQLQQGMMDGAQSGLAAVFIFFLIGILISSWLISGTIPTLIYYGFSIVSASFFFAIVFIITCIIGITIGSSLTTVATAGVAFISIASALDLSLALTAGAIVSGAFFGDKMSPLSDTTNLASSIVGIDLFEHIKNMAWTTVPAFILSIIAYAILSPKHTTVSLTNVETFQAALLETNLVHWYALLPLVLLVILSIKKVPALVTLAIGSIFGIALSFLHDPLSLTAILDILFNGYVPNTTNEAVNALLHRGGIASMFFTITLVLLALSMGGLLFTLGIIQSIFAKLEASLTTVRSVITGTAITGIGVNTLIGEQYLAILLTGEAFKEQYKKVGLAPKNLARAIEDSGTVVNPLVPWSVCGIFITDILGVSTINYFPFAFFCLLGPVLTVFFAWSGKTLSKI
ncbi:Na+/H+ antiporter NhaC [Metasolibacillus sp.]|uniref:Na+/H+ antiporter NhaC n=1 Tax=Metasolibacillus sp. TaxID=2703680 RepID=UPI00260125E3|nr:Na+/H+ antiporter NhaC [Metasolibacillus sp.]MCT6924821.1 Na+/H+ antiporter NhaC [Metasolibacillus sp.]MCT6941089.1 Na+/H+ antiporter NhaC [Metasolibacillus sp.]